MEKPSIVLLVGFLLISGCATTVRSRGELFGQAEEKPDCYSCGVIGPSGTGLGVAILAAPLMLLGPVGWIVGFAAMTASSIDLGKSGDVPLDHCGKMSTNVEKEAALKAVFADSVVQCGTVGVDSNPVVRINAKPGPKTDSGRLVRLRVHVKYSDIPGSKEFESYALVGKGSDGGPIILQENVPKSFVEQQENLEIEAQIARDQSFKPTVR